MLDNHQLFIIYFILLFFCSNEKYHIFHASYPFPSPKSEQNKKKIETFDTRYVIVNHKCSLEQPTKKTLHPETWKPCCKCFVLVRMYAPNSYIEDTLSLSLSLCVGTNVDLKRNMRLNVINAASERTKSAKG